MYIFPDLIQNTSFLPQDSGQKEIRNISIPDSENGEERMRSLNVPFCVNLMAGGNYAKGRFISISSLSGDAFEQIKNDSDSAARVAEHITMHKHDYFEVMFVIDGMVEQHIENGCYMYKKGRVCLMNRNTRHFEVFGDSYLVLYLCLSREFITGALVTALTELRHEIADFFANNLEGKALYRREYLDFTPVNEQGIQKVNALLEALTQELALKLPGCTYMVHGLIIRLFDYLQDSNCYSITHNTLDSSAETYLFNKITRFMEQQERRVSRTQLSETLRYSSDYIYRVVKKHTGMSISEYSSIICLKKAEQMLIESDMSITRIISSLGFENKTHFYKLFQHKHGITPMEYRQRHKRGS